MGICFCFPPLFPITALLSPLAELLLAVVLPLDISTAVGSVWEEASSPNECSCSLSVNAAGPLLFGFHGLWRSDELLNELDNDDDGEDDKRFANRFVTEALDDARGRRLVFAVEDADDEGDAELDGGNAGKLGCRLREPRRSDELELLLVDN